MPACGASTGHSSLELGGPTVPCPSFLSKHIPQLAVLEGKGGSQTFMSTCQVLGQLECFSHLNSIQS